MAKENIAKFFNAAMAEKMSVQKFAAVGFLEDHPSKAYSR